MSHSRSPFNPARVTKARSRANLNLPTNKQEEVRVQKSTHAIALVLVTLTIALLLVPKPESARGQSLAAISEPVFVELFTSQGCSSCPPADRLAARMAKERSLVIVSRPVDYWDRLGWKDTLASPKNTALQRTYAKRGLSGYNGVYTPQTVVNGRFGEVGSDESALRRQVRSAAQLSKAAIRVKRANGKTGVGLGGKTSRQAELVIVGVAKKRSVQIGRGENGGRKITYTNVLIGERRVATWNGGKGSHEISPAQMQMGGADRYAAVLRVPNGGEVLAAQWLN